MSWLTRSIIIRGRTSVGQFDDALLDAALKGKVGRVGRLCGAYMVGDPRQRVDSLVTSRLLPPDQVERAMATARKAHRRGLVITPIVIGLSFGLLALVLGVSGYQVWVIALAAGSVGTIGVIRTLRTKNREAAISRASSGEMTVPVRTLVRGQLRWFCGLWFPIVALGSAAMIVAALAAFVAGDARGAAMAIGVGVAPMCAFTAVLWRTRSWWWPPWKG